MDHYNFEPLGRWEVDRGHQYFGYGFAWHLGHDIAVTSEWGTPNRVENGVNPELLLGGKYGHSLHIWDLHMGSPQTPPSSKLGLWRGTADGP